MEGMEKKRNERKRKEKKGKNFISSTFQCRRKHGCQRCLSITRILSADDGNVPRRGIEIKITSHEKKEEENIQEKKEEENLPPPFQGVERFLRHIILGLLGLVMIKSHGNAEFPFKSCPRTMMGCVTGMLIYAFASSAEDILFIWRCPGPAPWYISSARLAMMIGLAATVRCEAKPNPLLLAGTKGIRGSAPTNLGKVHRHLKYVALIWKCLDSNIG
ncbi:hypothetical protein OSB04_029647 [Centaurea solstitialis]|uniref:Uncharacterized protein n=1 Tax=Centaurea solstitialis TaxID=347529 RepID=A0AA38W466_9ASTR|nr:hypothetical protein OSB04_029647 [Centaurea solstitialis]